VSDNQAYLVEPVCLARSLKVILESKGDRLYESFDWVEPAFLCLTEVTSFEHLVLAADNVSSGRLAENVHLHLA
jgi:hypothetical protein